jgi:hypothetical protein
MRDPSPQPPVWAGLHQQLVPPGPPKKKYVLQVARPDLLKTSTVKQPGEVDEARSDAMWALPPTSPSGLRIPLQHANVGSERTRTTSQVRRLCRSFGRDKVWPTQLCKPRPYPANLPACRTRLRRPAGRRDFRAHRSGCRSRPTAYWHHRRDRPTAGRTTPHSRLMRQRRRPPS